MVIRSLIVACVLMLAACASAPPKPCPAPDNRAECATFQQIDVACTDVLTDATAKAILAYDKAGEAACGWKPRPCR